MDATKSAEKLGSSAVSHALPQSAMDALPIPDLRFSVVIPLHNKARHIAACLESVRRQTFAPFEIIVVDDNSTDSGAAIVKACTDPRIRLFERSEPGPGGYAARNLAVDAAAGNWIAFLDADDIWMFDHLADIAAMIARHPELGCVATRYIHVFDDRRVASKISEDLAATADVPADFSRFLQLWLALGECPIWTGGAAFSRETLIAAGPFPAGKATRGGDKDLWLRAVAQAPFGYVTRPSAEFHRDSDNKVSKTTSTASLPIIVATARDMMARANTTERALLRRLVNQQIALYARYSFKDGPISPEFTRHLYLPEGLGAFALISALRLLPLGLRRRMYRAMRAA